MSTSITPSIGRRVWLWNGEAFGFTDAKQAFDVGICLVIPPDSSGSQRINCAGADHEGNWRSFRNIELRDPGTDDRHGTGETYATWMPYQMPQPAPTEAPAPAA